MKIATMLKKAAKTIACCGFSTPVETTVAIELAASWKPFMKSNATASATSSATTPNEISVGVIDGRSGILEDDALDQVGDVLATIGDRLEQLVDRAQLDQLAHVLLLAEQARHRRAHDAVGVGLEPVDLLAGLERRLGDVGLADLGQERDRVLDALAAFRAEVAEAQDVVVHRLHVVERHRLARVLEQVEDVVHGVDEAVDLLAVDRRDEGLVEEPVDLGGDLVGLALGVADLAGVLVAQLRIGVMLDQTDEGARALGDVRPVLVEELEEVAFAWQQLAEQHRISCDRAKQTSVRALTKAAGRGGAASATIPAGPGDAGTGTAHGRRTGGEYGGSSSRWRANRARRRLPARRPGSFRTDQLRRRRRLDRVAPRRQRPGQDDAAAHPGGPLRAVGGPDRLGRRARARAPSALPRPRQCAQGRPHRRRVVALPPPPRWQPGRRRRGRRGARALRHDEPQGRVRAHPLARAASTSPPSTRLPPRWRRK